MKTKPHFMWGSKVMRAGTFKVRLTNSDTFEVTVAAVRGGRIPLRFATGPTSAIIQAVELALNHLDQGQLDREGLGLVNSVIDSFFAGVSNEEPKETAVTRASKQRAIQSQ
jgi:hypothetical protein